MPNLKMPPTLRAATIFLTSVALWSKADARPANAILFEGYSTFLKTGMATFLNAVGAGGLTGVVDAALGLIPWLIIAFLGAVIAWQAWDGIKKFQQQNYTGILEPMGVILVAMILGYLADALSAAIST